MNQTPDLLIVLVLVVVLVLDCDSAFSTSIKLTYFHYVRPRETRRIPSRTKVPNLGDGVSGGVGRKSFPCKQTRADGPARPRKSFCAVKHGGRNGRRQGKQRAKFFDDARGSAIECAACLDASVAKRLSTVDRIQAGKEMLVRVVSMLSKLVERFDPDSYRVREGENTLGDAKTIEDEDDDEDEDEIRGAGHS
jgi:hypothetical protein